MNLKLVILSAVLLGACATTSEVDALRSRVTLLETRLADSESRNKAAMQQLDAKTSDENKALRRDLAMVGSRQDAVGQRVEILEGRTEEAQSSAGKINVNAERLLQIEEAQLKLKDQNYQLDQRLSAMEKVLTGGGAPTGGKEPLDDDAVYKEALAAHNEGEYKKAREGFERILKEKPDSKLTSNATFWIGEGYFKQKQYEEALGFYTSVVEKYPDSNKRCASLLKLGMILQEIGEKQKAKPFLGEVVKSCADTPEAAEAGKRLK